MARLTTPRALLLLILLMWVPLTLHVMFGHTLGAARNLVLLPAIPATVLLYVIAITTWRESWVAVIGAYARVLLAVHRGHGAVPAAARSQQADRAVCAAADREERRVLLAGRRFQGARHALAHAVGLSAGDRLGRDRDAGRLRGRHHVRPARRLSLGLVGRAHLVLRQRAAVVPGHGPVHRDPELPGTERVQHRDRGDLRLGAGDHAHRARADPGHQDARLRVRRADPGREPALHHAGRAAAERARADHRRCLPAPRLHHGGDHHADLPRPRPAAAGSGLGPDDQGGGQDRHAVQVLLHADHSRRCRCRA